MGRIIKHIGFLSFIIAGCFIFLSAEASYSEAKKTARNDSKKRAMAGHALRVVNGDFERHRIIGNKRTPDISGWEVDMRGFTVSGGKGFDGKSSLKFSEVKTIGDVSENYAKMSAEVEIPEFLRSREINVSVSAWVWSDTPLGAYISIYAGNMRAHSAFHSGFSGWEYLTVVFPFKSDLIKHGFKIELSVEKGIAMFDLLKPLALEDDRFEEITDNELRFAENIGYGKGSRIRIVFIGNSTIRGTGAPRNAAISYILQSKMESAFPGRFEVINYAIGCWNISNQIVSVSKNFVYKTWCNENGRRLAPDNVFDRSIYLIDGENADRFVRSQKNALTLAELKPDVVVFSSLWNDTIYPMFFDRTAFELRTVRGMPVANAYYRAIFDYMDKPDAENYAVAKILHDTLVSDAASKEAGFLDIEKDEVSAQVMRLRYDFLLNEFLKRSRATSKVWLLNLPSKGGSAYAELIDKAPEFMSRGAFLINDTSKEEMKKYYGVFASSSDIEESSLKEASRKYKIPFINAKDMFIDEFGGTSISDYVNLEYFHDTVHFTYRGNEWVADKIFMEMYGEFQGLLKNN